MNSAYFNGPWSDKKEKLRSRYQQLSEKDLTLISGKENELLRRIETRLGKNRREVEKILTEL